jgi:5-formyltetrahydrofolate cyclo-ligase
VEDSALLRVQIKAEIRQRRRAVRGAMPADARETRSKAICERVVQLPEFDRARTVLAFVSMRTEVQTHAAVEAARSAGKRVCATRMGEDLENLVVVEWRADDPLEESGYMFSQPSADSPVVPDDEIDLVIVPALALDERGHRIGFGKGYYDRLLPRLTSAFRAGVVFDFELMTEIPDRPGDEPVDAIVTDARLLRTER